MIKSSHYDFVISLTIHCLPTSARIFPRFQSLITVLLLCDHSDITGDGRRLVSHQKVHVSPVTALMTHLTNCLFSQRSHANGMKPTPVLHVNVDNVAMPVSLQTFNEVRQLSVTLL